MQNSSQNWCKSSHTDLERSSDLCLALQEKSEEGLALDAVTKNPRLLTVPEFEYQRTKPTLAPW